MIDKQAELNAQICPSIFSFCVGPLKWISVDSKFNIL